MAEPRLYRPDQEVVPTVAVEVGAAAEDDGLLPGVADQLGTSILPCEGGRERSVEDQCPPGQVQLAFGAAGLPGQAQGPGSAESGAVSHAVRESLDVGHE